MRVLILALSVLGILVSADAATAGPSTTTRDLTASVDEAIFVDEATQATEDQIGLDKRKRRDVQRRLTRLGFDTLRPEPRLCRRGLRPENSKHNQNEKRLARSHEFP